MCKEGNPKHLKTEIKQICGIILRVWRSAMHTILVCFGAFWMKNNQFRFFFPGKTATSLAGNFTMQKALFKNIFLHKIVLKPQESKL